MHLVPFSGNSAADVVLSGDSFVQARDWGSGGVLNVNERNKIDDSILRAKWPEFSREGQGVDWRDKGDGVFAGGDSAVRRDIYVKQAHTFHRIFLSCYPQPAFWQPPLSISSV